MKDSNRVRVLSAFCLSLLAALAAAPGLGADVALTASTSTGMMYGVASEFVYDTSTFNGNPYTVSELDWGIRPLYYTKASLTLSTSIGFAASLDVRMGVPGKSGSIDDSDWLNYDYNGDPTKTNFSRHDSFIERALLLDTQVGWEIALASWMTLEPFLAVGFMDFKWTARDGYLQYPPGYLAGSAILPYPEYSTQPKVPVSGTSIVYQQTYLIPALGISARFRFARNLGGLVSFAFSPFVLCNDLDNHEFAGADYYDAMRRGLLLEPKAALQWQVSGSALLSLDVSYRHIAGLVGTITKVLIGVGHTPGQVAGTYQNSAGASFDALDASLSLAWSL